MSEVALGKIGSDKWASHKIQNVVPSRTTAVRPHVSTKVPTGVSGGVSTISSMPQEEKRSTYVAQRPILKDPVTELQDGELLAIRQCLDQTSILIAESEMPQEVKSGYLRIIANMQISIEECAGNCLNHISNQSKLDSADLDELNLKNTENIRKYILETEKVDTWNQYSNILQYFLSASSIVLGTVLVSTGVAAVAGAFLIASGGLGLIDRIANDTHAYQGIISYFTKSREMQDKAAGYISSTVLLATIGLGLYGGIMNNLSAGLTLAKGTMTAVDAGKKFQLAIGLATGGAGAAKAWKEKELADISKALKLIENRITFKRDERKRRTSEANNTISMLQIITRSNKQTISAAG